jgi:hypothetical protein
MKPTPFLKRSPYHCSSIAFQIVFLITCSFPFRVFPGIEEWRPILDEIDSEVVEWVERFSHKPPPVALEGEADIHPLGLPTFTVLPVKSGRQLIRVSLPFPSGSFPEGTNLVVHSGDQTVSPGTRVLTWHPGQPRFVRRAIITFPFVFTSEGQQAFSLSLDRTRPSNDFIDRSVAPFKGTVGPVSVETDGNTVIWSVGDYGPFTAEVIAEPQDDDYLPALVEVLESSVYYLWVRILRLDDPWPRMLEVRADSHGTVAVRQHVQRREDGNGYTPDMGWSIEFDDDAWMAVDHRGGLANNAPYRHEFVNGVAAGVVSFRSRLDFPTAHLKRRGHLRIENGPGGRTVTYLRALLTEEVPMQESAWREADFVFRLTDSAALNSNLEPSHRIRVPAEYYDAIYGSGEELDLAGEPILDGLRSFHRYALAHSIALGDDYGVVDTYPPDGRSINRLNFAVPIFEDFFLSGDETLRTAALAWCANHHDFSIYWSYPDLDGEIDTGFIGRPHFGGTRYPFVNSRINRNSDPHGWRSNTAVDFCTKGFDAFFYAWEETGDPRMAVALYWQHEYSKNKIGADANDYGGSRNVGVANDWMHLYRFTGHQEYLDHALRLFRELRRNLFENHLFDQGGLPFTENPGFIDDDLDGKNIGYPKVYILGYALTGLPDLLEAYPNEPRLYQTITAIAAYLAEVQDPLGTWRYPHDRSSRMIPAHGFNHLDHLTRVAKRLEVREEPIDHLLDAIERGLQLHVQVWQKSGSLVNSIGGWEQSGGLLQPGQRRRDLYKTPEERDRKRDYSEGQIVFGAIPPEGLTHFTPVFEFYLKHRPAKDLFVQREPLQTFLERLPKN